MSTMEIGRNIREGGIAEDFCHSPRLYTVVQAVNRVWVGSHNCAALSKMPPCILMFDYIAQQRCPVIYNSYPKKAAREHNQAMRVWI